MKDKNMYSGKVKNTGVQVVPAPNKPSAPKGKGVVKTGNDLRNKGGK